MNVCVLIPVYNEARTIADLVKAILAKGLDCVVVDDGSTDGSGQLAESAGAHVIRHEAKNGKGYSLKQGFDYILQKGYLGVVAMDGDAQHAVEDIDHFLSLWEAERPDVIVGNRLADPKDMPWLRLMTNKVMSGLISSICKQNIPDTQCGFRLIATPVLKEIDISSSCYEIESEILIKASKKGFSIASVPIQTIYGDEESQINPFIDTLRFIRYIIGEMFSK